ncbi:MAG: hypothetical protein D6685_08510 [Bacteroidetes bacterium]|nr:MAG: hypothetical protein D6685_08510 [Bacteroidota bacterium]
MPHTIAESLFRTLLDAFPASRAYPPAFFEQDPMPPLVVHYLERTLHDRLERDVAHLSTAPEGWFDEQHPDVQDAYRRLKQTLHRHARIPAGVWADTLRDAVRRVTAYLVEPVPTLTAFVFEEGDGPRSVLTILHRLDYFHAYTYLHEAVKAYVEHKGVHELERDRFAGILRHIDRQMTQDYDPDAWVVLLRPLYDLVRGVPGLEAGVPPGLLARFFAEKGQAEMQQRLEARAAERDTPVSTEALRSLLAGPPAPAAPAAPSVAPEAGGAVPLWKRFQQQGSSAASSAPPAAPPRVVPGGPPAAPAPPRWQQFQGRPGGDPPSRAAGPVASPAGAPPLEALEATLFGDRGARNRELFVKHLFGGSLAEYERMLRRLQAAPDWKQASQLIAQDVFRKQQVNIYSEPAVAFTDAIEAYFRHA